LVHGVNFFLQGGTTRPPLSPTTHVGDSGRGGAIVMRHVLQSRGPLVQYRVSRVTRTVLWDTLRSGAVLSSRSTLRQVWRHRRPVCVARGARDVSRCPRPPFPLPRGGASQHPRSLVLPRCSGRVLDPHRRARRAVRRCQHRTRRGNRTRGRTDPRRRAGGRRGRRSARRRLSTRSGHVDADRRRGAFGDVHMSQDVESLLLVTIQNLQNALAQTRCLVHVTQPLHRLQLVIIKISFSRQIAHVTSYARHRLLHLYNVLVHVFAGRRLRGDMSARTMHCTVSRPLSGSARAPSPVSGLTRTLWHCRCVCVCTCLTPKKNRHRRRHAANPIATRESELIPADVLCGRGGEAAQDVGLQPDQDM